MKEALFVRHDGSYEILTYQKSVRWRWNGMVAGTPVGVLSEWEMVRFATGYDEVVPVSNILELKGMYLWKYDHPESMPVNKLATALQRGVSYLPNTGDIRGNVLITGGYTYSHRNSSRTDNNPTIRVNAHGWRGTGTIRTLGRRKQKLLIQRLELANRLGKSIIPVPEKEYELSTSEMLASEY